MNFKEVLRLVYGLIMGTSVQFIKPQKRYLFPTAFEDVTDCLTLQMGGSGICGILKDNSQGALLINVNQREAGEVLRSHLRGRDLRARKIFITNGFFEFMGSLELYADDGPEIFLPETHESTKVMGPLRERGFQFLSVEHNERFTWGEESLRVLKFQHASSSEDIVIALETSKILFTGGLCFNQYHPVLRERELGVVGNWVTALRSLAREFSDYTIVPAEGDLGSSEDLLAMALYLETLSSQGVEFSECRKRFDWREIPGQTTLEENFDILQGRRGNYLKL